MLLKQGSEARPWLLWSQYEVSRTGWGKAEAHEMGKELFHSLLKKGSVIFPGVCVP